MTTDQSRDGSLSLSEVAGTLSARGYSIIRRLGVGTYAKVFLASYVPANNPSRMMYLACKVVDTSRAPRDFVRRFLPRELDILKKLNHPHIIHVHSIFQRRSKFFIFMRLAEKGDLLDWIVKHGAVTESQSRVWMRQLTLALQYLQVLEIAHRDLKCENVLITANYNVKLADFGFARYCVDSRGRRVLSSTNCGSLSYAAPEILRGEHYDPRVSDVWSLGVVLYVMLDKAMPFDDTDINRLHDEQVHRRWRFCATVIETLSEQVKALMYSLLEPDLHRRIQVHQILASEWIAMDPRLAALTPTEQAALATAAEDRDRRLRRDTADQSGSLSVGPATIDVTAPAATGRADINVESVRYRADTSDTQKLSQEDVIETTLPRTPEETDMIAERQAAGLNPHAQPSHGAISIMENEPLPVTQPPEFLPPDLSEKLTSKAPSSAASQITKKETENAENRDDHDLVNDVVQQQEHDPALQQQEHDPVHQKQEQDPVNQQQEQDEMEVKDRVNKQHEDQELYQETNTDEGTIVFKPASSTDLELDTEPNLGTEQQLGTEPRYGTELVLGTEPDLGREPEIRRESELGTEPELGAKPELGTEPQLGTKPELGTEPELGTQPGPSTNPISSYHKESVAQESTDS